MATKRRRRFKRSAEDISHRLQARDVEIIKLVYDHRILLTRHVCCVIQGSEQGIKRRLQKLFHHEYVDRIKLSNNDELIHAIADRGADELAKRYGIERGKIEWSKRNRELKDRREIAHKLQTADFMITLRVALQDKPKTALVKSIREGELKDEVYFEDEQRKRIRAPVIPDHFFVLEDEGDELYFALESDRSTMQNWRYLRKLRAYFHFWLQKKHIKNWHVPADVGFRILTITKSEARKDNLRDIAKNDPQLARGLDMFWFTSTERYSINSPASVLQPIWQTAADDALHHLLE